MSSWSQRFSQLSGRWSPFARTPTTENGSAKVTESDYSYITAEDLKNGEYDRGSGPARDTDVLTFRNKRTAFSVHFPAYSIDRGELTIGDLRDQAARKLLCDKSKVKLIYKAKHLRDDARTCREEGLREGADIHCETGDAAPVDESSSESDDEGLEASDAATGDQPKRKRNRNRNKKKKGKKRSDAVNYDGLAVPSSENSRAPSPKPTIPQTPMGKLNALNETLQSLLPEAQSYIANPPSDPSKRDFDHKRLSETILTQVLLKLDGVETDEPETRARRKELVKETQRVLSALDAAKG